MEGPVEDGNLPWRSRIVAAWMDEYEEGGVHVGTSNPKFGRRQPIIRRQMIKTSVITLQKRAGADVCYDVV